MSLGPRPLPGSQGLACYSAFEPPWERLAPLTGVGQLIGTVTWAPWSKRAKLGVCPTIAYGWVESARKREE